MSHEPSADGAEHPGPPRPGPTPAPAFALLSAEGYPLESSDVFTRLVGLPALSTAAVSGAVGEIASGRSDLIALQLPLPDGSLAEAQAEAVNGVGGRLVLIGVAVPRPAGGPEALLSWFAGFGEDSEAIVWLKDVDGRYLSVNARYCEQLGVEPDRVRGLTDTDLSQFEAIDGPRNKRVGGPEPVQLEYVIPAFDRRPAYTAMRFPVPDAGGAALAVCGVASPADQADVANAECGRLLGVLSWLHDDPVALRRQLLAGWGITAVRPQGSPGPSARPAATAAVSAASPTPVPASAAQAPAGPGQLPLELAQLLQSLQRQVSELEAKVDSSSLEGRNPQHEATPDGRFELEQERRRHRDALERLEAELAELRSELGTERERAREAQAARQMLETRMLRVSEQLGASQRQVVELQAALVSAREQMTRLERAAAAATAAAASPIESSAPPAVNLPGRAAQPASDAPAAVQLGWDAAAQTALVGGLSGCLNVRSIYSEAVRLIGSAGGWEAVVAWLANEPDGRFRCAATWVRGSGDVAALETSWWQLRQSPTASAVGQAAASGELAWFNDPGRDRDQHLADLSGAGLATVILLPVRQAGTTMAVLEFASTGREPRSPAGDAALRSIESEVAAAHQRVTDTASATQWGRRSR